MVGSRALQSETCPGQASRTLTVGSGSIGASSFTRTIAKPKRFSSEKPGNWIPRSRADQARDIGSIDGEKSQLMRGVGITYRDLVKEYVRLNRRETTYRRVLQAATSISSATSWLRIPGRAWPPPFAPGRL